MSKKKQKDERGVAHLLYIVLVIVVIGVVAAVGIAVANKKKTPTTTATTSSTTASSSATDSSCLSAYHDSTLCKFASNSNDFEKTAYTATLAVTQSGTTSNMTLKSDGKGNTDLSGTSDGSTINAITLNGTSYIQSNGSGPWIEYPSGQSAPTTSSNPASSMNIGVGTSGITFKSDGTAACGSLTCYKYQIVDSTTPGSTQYVLFDNSSYKLRQWIDSDTSGNSTTMTISYAAVNITAPSPVESLSQAY